MATLDIVTLAEAKAALNIEADDDSVDTELGQVITAASGMVDQWLGPVVKRTVTDELHDGLGEVVLRHGPVLSVTTVTEYQGTTATVLTAESNSVKPGAGYLLEADGHRVALRRRAGGWDQPFATGRRNVAVTYVAGRAENTAAVDPRFKEACLVVVIHLWQHRGAGGDDQTGPAFGAVPFSTDQLRTKVRSMLPADARPQVIG